MEAKIQDMKKENEEKTSAARVPGYQYILAGIMMFLATAGGSFGAAYFYGKTAIEIAGIVILALAGMGSVLFSIARSRQEDGFLYDNGGHPWRLVVMYLAALSGSLIFPMLPTGGWPYLAIFVGLMLFSNQMVGLSAGTVLLMITVLLKGSEGSVFFIYFVSGLAGIVVFSYVNETFQIWMPMLISLLVTLVCVSVHEILLVNEVLSLQILAIPVMNVLVSLILLLILLKIFSVSAIYRKQDIYMDINDPECPLLVELKNFSKEEYFHAIHTAYLCDRIARRIHADEAVAKACGYYHRIGMMRGNPSWETVQQILEEYHFPEKVKNALEEYLVPGRRLFAKEAVILLFSDTVISSVSYLFSKEPEAQLDYSRIIETIFQKKLESGIIDYSDLTYGELQEMKKILVEEQLYYDFLR